VIKDIKDEDIDILIEILPTVNGTTNKIVPILQEIRKNPGYSLNKDEIKTIVAWNVKPQDTTKGDSTKAAKALVYIVLKNIGFKM